MSRLAQSSVPVLVIAVIVAGGASSAQASAAGPTPDSPTTSADHPVAHAAEQPAPGSAGRVALTFDDGPSRITPEILQVLDRHDVTATFFMQGSNVARHPGTARQVARAGHVVGNHGYSHRDFSTMPVWTAATEVALANATIRSATGVRPELFRYPFGRSSTTSDAVVRRQGMGGGVGWNWSVPLAGDFECPGAERVADYVEANAVDQGVVLLHDGNDVLDCGTDQLRYLDTVIPRLKARGFDFGVVAKGDGPEVVNNGVPVRVVAPRPSATR